MKWVVLMLVLKKGCNLHKPNRLGREGIQEALWALICHRICAQGRIVQCVVFLEAKRSAKAVLKRVHIWLPTSGCSRHSPGRGAPP